MHDIILLQKKTLFAIGETKPLLTHVDSTRINEEC
jgi:hypothetical protein